ncbi:ribbon-helix-helix domain-containing protein [Mycobacterium sp. URHB0044]|uniref:ribbon-helix-helix domain-containing protein n=1 Tax=Mycobacterium sp. URHB0044 TaxID=1380386 RepID=UPI00048E5B95|nr:ribbon-helix-helix domain-containing protein [Mycobacterium sp. URHB0044]
MKLSVSLSDEDVEVLDHYVERVGLPSRSAGVQRAIRMLRFPALENDYDEAWSEFASAGDEETWDKAASDGLGDAAR